MHLKTTITIGSDTFLDDPNEPIRTVVTDRLHNPSYYNNPHSLYNNQAQFCTLMEQLDTGVCCISESWNRSHCGGTQISDLIQIEGYKWVQNVTQKKRRGGKPAILINENMFHIKELCPDIITVPVGVEAVWALLTPKRL